MTKSEMMKTVYNHLPNDYNCMLKDFEKDGILFTLAEKSESFFGWKRSCKIKLLFLFKYTIKRID